MRVLQVTPTIYSRQSVIGGGEKGVVYVDHSLRRAAAADGLDFSCAVLSFGVDPDESASEREIEYRVIPGTPWDAASIDPVPLLKTLRDFDSIYIDQCLTPVGAFVGAQARLMDLRVVGKDSGGGEHHRFGGTPDMARIFHAFHAQSEFAAGSFSAFGVEVHVIPGPLDSELFRPPSKERRNSRLVVAVGRLMPHKGFDRIIRALPTQLSLVIVGQSYDKPYHDELVRLAAGKDVSFREDLDDTALRSLLRRAGLFVHASTHFDSRGNYIPKPELLGLAPLEAISSGLPTLVSNAAALPELARLPGCVCFQDDTMLGDLFRAHVEGALSWPCGLEMNAAVDRLYGPVAFGRALLDLLRSV